MTDLSIAEGPVEEGADGWNVGQIALPDGVLALQGDITSWGLDVFARGNSTAIYSISGMSSTLVIFNTPQTDGFWGLDSIGYNFLHQVTQTALASQSAVLEGGRRYLFHYNFITSLYGTLHARFIWRIQAGPAF